MKTTALRLTNPAKECQWLILISGGDTDIEFQFFETQEEAEAEARKYDPTDHTVWVCKAVKQTQEV